ncbi:hypothetical protein THIX_20357 [Thiomonas sp. X19]|nr:hypothetical protein THIX_20357 [Thiomonas sp. X19]
MASGFRFRSDALHSDVIHLALLDAHDAYGFFQGTGDLLVTGPTYTNVNDFRAVLVV